MIATIVVILAAMLLVSDPYAKRIGEETNLLADINSICASMPWAAYFYVSSILKQFIPTEKIAIY